MTSQGNKVSSPRSIGALNPQIDARYEWYLPLSSVHRNFWLNGTRSRFGKLCTNRNVCGNDESLQEFSGEAWYEVLRSRCRWLR